MHGYLCTWQRPRIADESAQHKEHGITKQRTGCRNALDCKRNRFLPSLHASFIALPHALSMYTLQFVSHGLAFMWCAKALLALAGNEKLFRYASCITNCFPVLCTYMHVYVIMHDHLLISSVLPGGGADASLGGAAPGFCHVV